ncbi:GTPase, partial [Reticulomyxa filosa]
GGKKKKKGKGISELFNAIIDRIPPPKGNIEASPRVLLYDSFWDAHRGVVCLVFVKDGCLRVGDTVGLYHSNREFVVQECGVIMPHLQPMDMLRQGQVGYMMANVRDPAQIIIGDTIYLVKNRKLMGSKFSLETTQFQEVKSKTEEVTPFTTLHRNKCMVFACLYPVVSEEYNKLRAKIKTLMLEDASVKMEEISNETLGAGFRCGFLGVLHMEVFRQRLEDESGVQVIVAAPTITYKAIRKHDQQEFIIESPEEYPENPGVMQLFLQPMVRVTVMFPAKFLDDMLRLLTHTGGVEEELNYVGQNLDTIVCKYKFPLNKIVTDFYSSVHSITHGLGSFDYEECGWEPIDLVQVRILINKKSIGPLSVLCEREKAMHIGRTLCEKLADVISRELFEVNIQAVLGGKIIAKRRLQAHRKNVLEKAGKIIGQGDMTRKRKLLDAQKEGKKRMKEIGNVKVPQSAFMAVLKIN